MRKRKSNEEDEHWELLYAASITGTIQQLTDLPLDKHFKPNKPIGFLADIDGQINEKTRKSNSNKKTS